MTEIKRLVPIVILPWALVAVSWAQNPPAEESSRSSHLLDRGSATAGGVAPGPPVQMDTLAVGSATPGVTMIGVLSNATVGSEFLGNFYTAPADFPTFWYPFNVTGAFAYQTMVPSPPGDIILGAGVAPGPFPGGMGTMWAAFATAMFPVPPFMTPSVFGAPGIFPSSPAVATGQGVVCGLLTRPLGPAGGPALGGLTGVSPVRRLYSFNGPPVGADELIAQPYSAFIHWVAGCYVSGATVPVELQSFHIE